MRDLELARLIYADARTGIQETPNIVLLLDLSLAALEFERAIGEDFSARDHFFEALDLLSGFRGVEPWLFGGVAQVGWTAFQLSRYTGMQLKGLDRFDGMILDWITNFPDDHDVDLPSGLLGLGVYALSHPDPAVREKMTAQLVTVVESRAEHDEHGLFVRLAPYEARLRTRPEVVGHRDLGVAHGSAGLVSFLASLAMSGLPSAQRGEELLRSALGWLMHHRRPLEGTVYPHSVESRYEPSRSAWCYGDPGTAMALAVAARATGSAEVAAEARTVARAALTRPPERAKVMDACLCHGAAGLVWFGCAARAEWELPEAADFVHHWSGYIHQQRADGPLHYLVRGGFHRDHSFLEGDLGAALAMLTLATGVPPAWAGRMLGAAVLPPEPRP